MEDSDQFAFSVFSLAFALKKLVESDYYDESKHNLIQDFTRLNNRVQLLIKILENKERAKKYQQQQQQISP